MVSQPSEYGLENFLFGTRGLREYQVGTSFRIKNTMAFLQMTGYYNILCQREIEIEDIYKWFFEKEGWRVLKGFEAVGVYNRV